MKLRLPRVKSFRDRNPYVIGIVSVGIIGVLVGLAFAVGALHLLEDTYELEAEFTDAAGIRGGDEVRVAGVKAGRVTGVEADHRRGLVRVKMVVDKGVHLGPETRAEVALETLLGTKYLRLSGPVVKPYLADQDERRRRIPVTRTKTPFDVFELTTIGTRSIQETDTDKLNQFIRQLADITEGKQADVRQLVDGIARVSRTFNERDAELRQLLDRLDRLSALLAEKDETLVGLIDQSQAVLDVVQRRRTDIVRGIRGGEQAAGQLGAIVSTHKSQIDAILLTLHPTLDILDRRAATVDRSLSWIGPGALGLSKATSHGPWQDIYVRAVGPDVIRILSETLKANPPPPLPVQVPR